MGSDPLRSTCDAPEETDDANAALLDPHGLGLAACGTTGKVEGKRRIKPTAKAAALAKPPPPAPPAPPPPRLSTSAKAGDVAAQQARAPHTTHALMIDRLRRLLLKRVFCAWQLLLERKRQRQTTTNYDRVYRSSGRNASKRSDARGEASAPVAAEEGAGADAHRSVASGEAQRGAARTKQGVAAAAAGEAEGKRKSEPSDTKAQAKQQAKQDAAALLVLLSQSAEPKPESASASGLECDQTCVDGYGAGVPSPHRAAQSPMDAQQAMHMAALARGHSSFPPHLPEQQQGRPPKRAVVKVDRVLRCGACDGCKRADCGRCPNCRDKPKFGGAGVKKQACQHRRCLQPTRTGGGRWAQRPQVATGEFDSEEDACQETYHSPGCVPAPRAGDAPRASGPSAAGSPARPARRHVTTEDELQCELPLSPGLSHLLDRTPLSDAQQVRGPPKTRPTPLLRLCRPAHACAGC